MTDDFPADIKQFIATFIKSVAELEAVLLLRNARERRWTAAEVSQALYSSPETAVAQLRDLSQRGLLEMIVSGTDESFQYRPSTTDIDRRLEELAELYKVRRVSVITAIYAEPTDTVRTFADAFRLRKEK